MGPPTGSYVNKWAAGNNYGPVLSQTDLYLLKPKLHINPIFTRPDGFKFSLNFDIATGSATGFNEEAPDRDYPFTQGAEPATLPRVQELYIVTADSPWCTTVRSEAGITMQDVLTAIWKDYTEHAVTDAELAAVPPRVQEAIKRAAANNAQPPGGYMYSPAPARLRRVDWLRDRHLLDTLNADHPGDNQYIESRLGFVAPNILIMRLTNSVYY